MIKLRLFVVQRSLLGHFTREAVMNYNVPVYLRQGDFVRDMVAGDPMIPKEVKNNLVMVITADYDGKYDFKC